MMDVTLIVSESYNCSTRCLVISPQARNTEAIKVWQLVRRSLCTAWKMSSQMFSMILASGLWAGHTIIRMSCSSSQSLTAWVLWHGALSSWNMNGWRGSPNIILMDGMRLDCRTSMYLRWFMFPSTMVSSPRPWILTQPHTIIETPPLVRNDSASGEKSSPAVLQHPTRLSSEFRQNRDSSENTTWLQLSGTVQFRIWFAQVTRRSLFCKRIRGFLRETLLNTLAECRQRLAVITDTCLFVKGFHWADNWDALAKWDSLEMVTRRRSSLAVVILGRPDRGNILVLPVCL